ncbi:MAG TPA: amidohydrolase family protein [Verrucomicrobiota bacterium]|nr:amidohydrolase family protein [Verrucomicrobiota bacterium]
MKSAKPLRRFVCWTAAGLVLAAVAALIARAIWFEGPYQRPASVPPQKLVDLHVHTAGIGAGDSGCFVSRDLQHSYKFDIYLKAFGVTREELDSNGDALLIRRIAEAVSRSKLVGAAVVLALDGAVNADGELDRHVTEVYVPNEFVAAETAKFTNLWFGASVNPYRRDAIERLDWAAAQGAVLVKWIPSIMQIDPSDERLIPFYERMKTHGLPLLSHTGQERSFTRANDALADPERLRLPLRLGVTVIAAHIASTGSNEGEADVDRLAKVMKEFPNLYSEISSLTQANKFGYLRQALSRPEFAGRLCYGSDFPLINTALVSPWYFSMNLTAEQMRTLAEVENPWDRDVLLKQALGVPPDIFTRSRELLPRAGVRTPAGTNLDSRERATIR